MSLRHIPLEKVDETALAQLLVEGAEESKHLDYKLTISLGTDSDKKEFLSDLTSFANTEGGELVYGIEENAKGKPAAIRPLIGFNSNDTILQMQSIIRDGVQPRIAGVAFQPIQLSGGGFALVVRIPASLSAPHMVVLKGSRRFCGRDSKGKHDLDVHQLRSAFLATSGMSDALQRFRLERLSRIHRDDCGSKLATKQRFALHLLPVESLRNSHRFDARALSSLDDKGFWPPGEWRSRGPHIRFDGIRHVCSVEQEVGGYVHVFRDGMMEVVWCWLGNTEHRRMNPRRLEKNLVEAIPGYLKGFELAGIQVPIVVGYALIGFKGFRVTGSERDLETNPQTIEDDILVLPEVLIEDATRPIADILKGVFDQVWNTSGRFGSPNYSPDGRWQPEPPSFRPD